MFSQAPRELRCRPRALASPFGGGWSSETWKPSHVVLSDSVEVTDGSLSHVVICIILCVTVTIPDILIFRFLETCDRCKTGSRLGRWARWAYAGCCVTGLRTYKRLRVAVISSPSAVTGLHFPP